MYGSVVINGWFDLKTVLHAFPGVKYPLSNGITILKPGGRSTRDDCTDGLYILPTMELDAMIIQ
jgi:hypothetical protein